MALVSHQGVRFKKQLMNKLLQGEELEKRAKDLGVDIQGPPRTQSVSGSSPRADDHELQKRVQETERSIRENRLWLIAVISAIASVVSAITALVAVLIK
jgi:sugar diacid utilization regulator